MIVTSVVLGYILVALFTYYHVYIAVNRDETIAYKKDPILPTFTAVFWPVGVIIFYVVVGLGMFQDKIEARIQELQNR